MPAFDDVFNTIKSQVTDLAKTTVKDYAAQAASDANDFLESTKDKLETWSGQLVSGKIDQDEFAWLLNSQQALGQMKVLTQVGLAQIQIDSFTNGVKKIVLDGLLSLAGKLL
ncbi:MAG TPA: hypothetical protein VG738_04955 [Chitinophagaceae bacterium]|nr:hypothetical protein [Chitinophagaceae bacterium]